MIKKIILTAMIILSSGYTMAENSPSSIFSAPPRSEGVFNNNLEIKNKVDILPAEKAFQPTVEYKDNIVSVNFNTLAGYYLYKDKFKITVNGKIVDNNNIQYPQNPIKKNDDIFGNVDVYEYSSTFKVKLENSQRYNIDISYQGCSETYNICYPVEKIQKDFDNLDYKDNVVTNLDATNKSETFGLNISSNEDITNIINNKSFILTTLIFLGIGLLLSFSPCVFPTLPLMSALVVGTNKKPLLVSSIYGLGFISSYAMIGLIIDVFAINLQIAIQSPVFIIISAILFLILGFVTIFSNSGFGTQVISSKIDGVIRKINKNNLLTTYIVGFLSSLILSPCAVAPLGATLIFISQQNQLFYGMWLLSILALGMIAPLVLMSTILKKIMPENGDWLYETKKILGFLLFGFALYTISRYLPHYMFNTILIFIMGTLLITINNKTIKIVVLGISLLIFNIFNPNIEQRIITQSNNEQVVQKSLKQYFLNIENKENLNEIIKTAESQNKELLVYIGAEWCTSCKEMDATTFIDKELIESYKMEENNKILAKIDITDFTNEKKDILKEYGLEIAPYFVSYKYGNNKKLNINSISVGYLKSSELKKIL